MRLKRLFLILSLIFLVATDQARSMNPVIEFLIAAAAAGGGGAVLGAAAGAGAGAAIDGEAGAALGAKGGVVMGAIAGVLAVVLAVVLVQLGTRKRTGTVNDEENIIMNTSNT